MPNKSKKLTTYTIQKKKAVPTFSCTEAEKFRRSNAWRTYSETVRKLYPECQNPECNKTSQEVHHILPLSTHMDLRLTLSNTLPLCVSCHRRYESSTPPEVLQLWLDTTNGPKM